MLHLPNLPHESVPAGKSAEDNPEIRAHGAKAAFSFKPKTHVELCESLKLVDFARAAKLSGSGFLLYTNWGARLERALIQFLLDLHITQHGYTEVSPPFMVGRALHGRRRAISKVQGPVLRRDRKAAWWWPAMTTIFADCI